MKTLTHINRFYCKLGAVMAERTVLVALTMLQLSVVAAPAAALVVNPLFLSQTC